MGCPYAWISGACWWTRGSADVRTTSTSAVFVICVFLYWTSPAALRMNEATTEGWDNMGTWLDDSVIDEACIRSTNIFWSAGGTTRSWAVITNQLGLERQAAVQNRALRTADAVGRWVVTSLVCSD